MSWTNPDPQQRWPGPGDPGQYGSPQPPGWTPPTDPVEREALARLSRTGWRLRHSLWLIPAIFTFGLLTWVSFAYVGGRARKARWWIPAVGYLVAVSVAFGLFASTPEALETTIKDDVGGVLWLCVWVGGIVHALVVNPAWLAWRARFPWNRYGGVPGMGAPLAPPPGAPVPPYSPAGAPGYGYPTAGPDTPEPPRSQEPGALLDVNRADAGQLAMLPGFTPALAERMVEVRSSHGGFASVAEFARMAEVQPHEFLRLETQLTCSPPSPPSPPPQGGRVLDI